MNHTQKRKLARRLLNKNYEQYLGIFNSLRWRQRKWQIIQRVKRQEARARYHSEVRKGLRG